MTRVTKRPTRKQGRAQERPGWWLEAANWLLVGAAALVPLATGFVPFAGASGVFMSRSTTPPETAALGLLVGGSLLCWAVALVGGETQPKRVPYGWVVAAFLAVVLASVFTALDPTVAVFGNESTQQGLLTMAAYAAVFVLATQIVQGRRHLLRMLQALALSGAAVALFGVLQAFGLPYLPVAQESYLTDRGTSSLGNPDMLGTFLIIPLLISLGLSLSTTGRQKWLWMSCAGVTSASLLLTQTRGAWLGALVALIVFGVVIFRSPRRTSGGSTKWIAAGLIVLVGAGVAIFKAVTGEQSLLSRLTQAGAEANGGRLFLWSEVLKVIEKHPILGAGPDNIVYGWYQVSTSAQVRFLGVDGVIYDAHNYWLGTAVSSGILAALLLVGIVVAVLIGSRSAVTERLALPGAPDRVAYTALWAGVVGFGVALTFSPALIPAGLLLWLSLGLLAVPKVRPTQEGVSAARTRYLAVALSAAVGLSLVSWGGATGLSSSIERVTAGGGSVALQSARTASRIAPWREYSLLLEARALVQDGASAQEIVPVFNRLIKLVPHGYEYYMAKAQVLGAQPKLVIATADEGLAIYPQGLRLIVLRAQAQAMLGDFAPAERDAAAAWSIARGANPTFREPSVGIAYAQILSAEGKSAQAKAVLGELEAAFPRNSDVAKLRAVVTTESK